MRVHNLGAERDTLRLKLEVLESENERLKNENENLNEVAQRLWDNVDTSYHELFPSDLAKKYSTPIGQIVSPKSAKTPKSAQ